MEPHEEIAEPKEPYRAAPSLEIDADILASLLRQGLRILEAQDEERAKEAAEDAKERANESAGLDDAEEKAEEFLKTAADNHDDAEKQAKVAADDETQEQEEAAKKILPSCDLKGVATRIKEGKVKKIVVMCGAGISVSAGIPDFRTPGTGLYSQLEKYQLNRPEDIFTLSFFRQNPRPFYTLAKELFPGSFRPTPTHYFIKLLEQKGLLKRCYTQNIDSLESQAGLPPDLVVAAHGNFDSCHCLQCGKLFTTSYFKDSVIGEDTPCLGLCLCDECGGLVKPDIVFFGEGLPDRFFALQGHDLRNDCDLLMVMGTSLVVYPFAGLCDLVDDRTPRLLINRELVGDFEDTIPDPDNERDAAYLGDCDAGVTELAQLLGWQDDLIKLIETETSHKDSATV